MDAHYWEPKIAGSASGFRGFGRSHRHPGPWGGRSLAALIRSDSRRAHRRPQPAIATAAAMPATRPAVMSGSAPSRRTLTFENLTAERNASPAASRCRDRHARLIQAGKPACVRATPSRIATSFTRRENACEPSHTCRPPAAIPQRRTPSALGEQTGLAARGDVASPSASIRSRHFPASSRT